MRQYRYCLICGKYLPTTRMYVHAECCPEDKYPLNELNYYSDGTKR